MASEAAISQWDKLSIYDGITPVLGNNWVMQIVA